MSSVRELYQEVILDHNKSPRNYVEIKNPDRFAAGHNPLCGDKLTIALKLEGDKITEAAFQGSGCAISKASASIMTTVIKGKTQQEALQLFERFRNMVSGKEAPNAESMGKLDVFAGVAEFPARVKCASLAWHTLKAALDSKEEPVSTE